MCGEADVPKVDFLYEAQCPLMQGTLFKGFFESLLRQIKDLAGYYLGHLIRLVKNALL